MFSIETKEVILKKYGVESTLQLDEIKNKSRRTLENKYGVDNIMKCEIGKEKFKDSMIKLYGVEYAQQSTIIQEKTKLNNIKKYGVKHPMYLSDIRKKIADTLFVNGVRVSKNQLLLSKNLGGSLNTNINGYYADIVLIDKKIIVEYNGSGHDLSVKLNKITKEEFNERENNRLNTFINNGWKCLIVENIKEKYINKTAINAIKDKINQLINSNEKIMKYIIS